MAFPLWGLISGSGKPVSPKPSLPWICDADAGTVKLNCLLAPWYTGISVRFAASRILSVFVVQFSTGVFPKMVVIASI